MPVTNYIWDDDNIVAEVDENGDTIVDYTYKPQQYGELISQRRWDGASWQTRYHQYDALGSTIALTDETGAVTDRYTYDAWGNEIAPTSAFENPFRWVGKSGYYWDHQLLTYQIRVRTFNAINGRWLSSDPLEFTDGVNSYFPYFIPSDVDPSGLATESDDAHSAPCCPEEMCTVRLSVAPPYKDGHFLPSVVTQTSEWFKRQRGRAPFDPLKNVSSDFAYIQTALSRGDFVPVSGHAWLSYVCSNDPSNGIPPYYDVSISAVDNFFGADPRNPHDLAQIDSVEPKLPQRPFVSMCYRACPTTINKLFTAMKALRDDIAAKKVCYNIVPYARSMTNCSAGSIRLLRAAGLPIPGDLDDIKPEPWTIANAIMSNNNHNRCPSEGNVPRLPIVRDATEMRMAY